MGEKQEIGRKARTEAVVVSDSRGIRLSIDLTNIAEVLSGEQITEVSRLMGFASPVAEYVIDLIAGDGMTEGLDWLGDDELLRVRNKLIGLMDETNRDTIERLTKLLARAVKREEHYRSLWIGMNVEWPSGAFHYPDGGEEPVRVGPPPKRLKTGTAGSPSSPQGEELAKVREALGLPPIIELSEEPIP